MNSQAAAEHSPRPVSVGGEGSAEDGDVGFKGGNGGTLLAQMLEATRQLEEEHLQDPELSATAAATTAGGYGEDGEDDIDGYGSDDFGEDGEEGGEFGGGGGYDFYNDDDELTEYRNERAARGNESGGNDGGEGGFPQRRQVKLKKTGDGAKTTVVKPKGLERSNSWKGGIGIAEVRVGSVVVNKTNAAALGISLEKLSKRFGLKKGDEVEVTHPGSEHKGKKGAITSVQQPRGKGAKAKATVRFPRLKEGKEVGFSSAEVPLSSLTRVPQKEVDMSALRLHAAEGELGTGKRELAGKRFMTQGRKKSIPKSDGFFTISDRKECTFMPRKKTAAEMKVAIAAGLKGGGDGNDEDLMPKGFQPSGTQDKLQLERTKAVEWEKRFCKRQDATIKAKREDLDRTQKEAAYNAILDKKECPVCHAKMSYDEMVTKKKACRGEHCNGALYVYIKTYDRKRFEKRQKSYESKHEKGLEELKRKIANETKPPPKPPKPPQPKRPQSLATSRQQQQQQGQENRPPLHGLQGSTSARHHPEEEPIVRSLQPARYVVNRAGASSGGGVSGGGVSGGGVSGSEGQRSVHGRGTVRTHNQQRQPQPRPYDSLRKGNKEQEGGFLNEWELEQYARQYVQGRAQQLAREKGGGGSSHARPRSNHQGRAQQLAGERGGGGSSHASTRPRSNHQSSSHSEEKWNSLLD